jgi:hypothetical protein
MAGIMERWVAKQREGWLVERSLAEENFVA